MSLVGSFRKDKTKVLKTMGTGKVFSDKARDHWRRNSELLPTRRAEIH